MRFSIIAAFILPLVTLAAPTPTPTPDIYSGSTQVVADYMY